MAKMSMTKEIRMETFRSSGRELSRVFTCLLMEGTEFIDFKGLSTLSVLRAESLTVLILSTSMKPDTAIKKSSMFQKSLK